MQGGATSGTSKPAANITATTSDGRPPICADFYTSASGGQAFTAQSSAYATTPGGDCPLKTSKNTTSTYASTVTAILSTSSYNSEFETKGYKAYSMTTATFARLHARPRLLR